MTETGDMRSMGDRAVGERWMDGWMDGQEDRSRGGWVVTLRLFRLSGFEIWLGAITHLGWRSLSRGQDGFTITPG
jgi:hypothetical protein